jgi:hypothetical protein
MAYDTAKKKLILHHLHVLVSRKGLGVASGTATLRSSILCRYRKRRSLRSGICAACSLSYVVLQTSNFMSYYYFDHYFVLLPIVLRVAKRFKYRREIKVLKLSETSGPKRSSRNNVS